VQANENQLHPLLVNLAAVSLLTGRVAVADVQWNSRAQSFIDTQGYCSYTFAPPILIKSD
jgi:hypothetical protein